MVYTIDSQLNYLLRIAMKEEKQNESYFVYIVLW